MSLYKVVVKNLYDRNNELILSSLDRVAALVDLLKAEVNDRRWIEKYRPRGKSFETDGPDTITVEYWQIKTDF